MQKSKTAEFLTIAYFIIALLEVFAIITEAEFLHHAVKPLLMPALIAIYLILVKNGKLTIYWILVISLIFSWLGDAFLMYQAKNPMYFILGLGSFLMAHILYIVAYIKMSDETKVDKQDRPRLARYDFFLVIIWLALMTVLTPVLGEMKIPVVIYSLAITGMALAALHRFGKTTRASFALVMAGALIFMLSDSMIAINKFMEPIYMANVWIMVTYVVAQYLIVQGILAHQTTRLSDQ